MFPTSRSGRIFCDERNAGRKAWDADDPRRQNDCFAPPAEPCECYCLHCNRVVSSDEIWFQRVINGAPGEIEGFWMCPTPNCSGAGFTFDIFPTDESHPGNAGWHWSSDEDEDEDDFDDDVDDNPSDGVDDVEPSAPRFRGEINDDIVFLLGDGRENQDPPADLIEPGDEWKLGYRPDEPAPPGIYGDAAVRAEQAEYDEPDRRPRIIDRSKEPPPMGEDDRTF